jgi:alpha-galactosidase/6-phospho-beta-glucosidase family protein
MIRNKKIVVIGAGSLQFGLGTVGSIFNSKILKGSTVVLHDINEDALKTVHLGCQQTIAKRNYDIVIEYTTDRKQALKNADYVINSIEVGPRFDYWDQDQNVTRKYFPKQLFGENGGPGGFFHALRIVPPILDICEDITNICPKAFFINYSNPMSRICLAIKRKYPNLKFIGLCHEIHFAELALPRMMKTKLSNIEIKAGGLNHFGVILGAKYKDTGEDGYPAIRKRWKRIYNFIKIPLDYDLTNHIFQKFGYLPYTSDSHYGEYIEWAREIADIKGVKRFKKAYMWYLKRANKKINRCIKKGKGYKVVKPDSERAIPIIESIITDGKTYENSVNVPNDGIISNLPKDLVVECPAIVDKDGVHGIPLGDYPDGLVELLQNQANVQDLVVKAILTKSKDTALQALLADPIVDDEDKAKALLDEMIALQSPHIKLE